MTSYLDRNNSKSTLLLDGEIYYGNPTNVDRFQGVIVSLKTDQNGVLTLYWSNDMENWDFTSVHNVTGGTPLVVTKQNQGSYFKISVENDSGNDQTYLRVHARFVNDVPDLDNVTMNVSGNIATIPVVESTLWDSDTVLADAVSASVNTQYVSKINVIGAVDAACDLVMQQSHNNISWVDSQWTLSLAGSGDFSADVTTHSKYIRFSISAGATVTLHVYGKM